MGGDYQFPERLLLGRHRALLVELLFKIFDGNSLSKLRNQACINALQRLAELKALRQTNAGTGYMVLDPSESSERALQSGIQLICGYVRLLGTETNPDHAILPQDLDRLAQRRIKVVF